MPGYTRLLSLSLAVCACLALSAGGDSPTDKVSLALLGGLGIALELSAVKLPRFGFLSSSYPCYFCLALLPGVGPFAASTLLVSGLLLRALLRRRDSWHTSLIELVSDAVPGLASLTLAGFLLPLSQAGQGGFPTGLLAVLGTLVLYLVTGHLIPNFAAFELGDLAAPVREKLAGALHIQVRASAVSGPMLLLLAARTPWQALWMTPVFLGLYQFSWDRLQELEAVKEREQVTKKSLDVREKQLMVTERTLAGTQTEKDLVERCAHQFATTDSVQQTMEALHSIVSELFACQTFGVYLSHQGLLQSAYLVGPYSKAAKKAVDPLVEHCWKSGKRSIINPQSSPPKRIFRDEQHAAAFPLHNQGVFYVGDPSRPISKETYHCLSVVADQASLGLQIASRQEALQAALDRVDGALKDSKSANQRLADWNERFFQMLDGSRQMASSFELESILGALEKLLLEVVPFSWGVLRHQGQLYPLGSSFSITDEEEIHELLCPIEPVPLNEGPLLSSRQRSGILASIGDGPEGSLLLLASETEAAYSAEHFQVLGMLSLHTEVVLSNCSLFQSVEESQAQLVQSTKMAAVGQLAAGMAHEINTPLGGVMLGIQSALLALSKGRTERAVQKLEKCVTGARVAKEIVANVLKYSRQGSREHDEVDLIAVVRETVDFLGAKMKTDDVKLDVALLSTPTIVSGNATELQQILTNLLINGRDAVIEAGGERLIKISTVVENKDVLLEVKDSGRGVPEQLTEKIFDPFFTSKAVGRGTGLGLYISRQIAERHQGKLLLLAKTDSGARFQLRLPLANSARA